jgi:peroxiredoxin
MKCVATIVLLSLFLRVFNPHDVLGKVPPASESQLLQEFEIALKAKDKDAILSLYNWEGVFIGSQSGMNKIISDALEQPIKGVKLAPLPKGFCSTYEYRGFRFAANVAVIGVIEVEFVSDNYSLPILAYGRKGNAFYLAGTVREKIVTTNSFPAETSLFTIQVRTADGQPLTNAVIVSADPDTIPRLAFTNLTGGLASFHTDQQGRFTLPFVNSNLNLFLVAASPKGFGWLPKGDLTNQAVMVLEPWGRIDGIWKNRNQEVTGEDLRLYLDQRYYGPNMVAPVYVIQKTLTDAGGRFAFEYLPPLKLSINRLEKQIYSTVSFWFVDERFGENKKLAINTRCRTVFGRVKVGPELGTNFDLTLFTGSLDSILKGREGLRRMSVFPISADGSFHADWVEPGDYTIELLDFKHGNKSAGMLDPISVHIPDDASAAVDVPFDMGTVNLNAALKPADTAPDFAVSTLDGKPLKLSNYRGKYVLLDFWATWCEPCVAETPNLKAVHAAFGQDQQFVMISLSLDSEPEAPRKFVRQHGTDWTQVFLGDWSMDRVTQTFGIDGIPAILLIGPDGKIIANNLRGSKIKEAVAAVLVH